MFENLRKVNPDAISDFRGFIDPSNLKQFNQFEGGYSLFTVVSIPYFLYKLATSEKVDPNDPNGATFKSKYGPLIKTYVRVLENEFRGLSGIDDISADTGEFTNNITQVAMINKVTQQSNADISMTYTEKAGAPLTRVHELFLTGIKDPRTQYKRYHGLVDAGEISFDQIGFQSECFSFLYIITDNTGCRIEKSFYIVGAQPKSAAYNELYNSEKGNYDFKEISTEFTGNILTGNQIDAKASKYLQRLTGIEVVTDIDTKQEKANKVSDPIFDAVTTDFKKYEALTDARHSNPNGSLLGNIGDGLHETMRDSWRNNLLGEE